MDEPWPRDLLYGVVRHLLGRGWSSEQITVRLPIGWGTVQRIRAQKARRYAVPPVDPDQDPRICATWRVRLAEPFPPRRSSGKYAR